MLHAKIDTLEGVPEVLHEHYEKDGDAYRLRVEGYDDTGLKTVLEDKKGEVKKLREKLTQYEGIDPEEVAELRALREEYEMKVAHAGRWEEQKERLEKQFQKQLDQRQADLAGVTGQLEGLLKENAAREALAKNQARVDALLPHVLGRVNIVTDADGTRKAVAVGLDGQSETDIGTLVAEMKANEDAFGWGFLPNGNSGGGTAATKTTGGSGAGKVRSKKDLKSAAEHSRFIADHGLQAYQELPRE
ncbi:MAG: hypothetical protein VW362_06770 [Candidatus Nanopelagicales bacterium]